MIPFLHLKSIESRSEAIVAAEPGWYLAGLKHRPTHLCSAPQSEVLAEGYLRFASTCLPSLRELGALKVFCMGSLHCPGQQQQTRQHKQDSAANESIPVIKAALADMPNSPVGYHALACAYNHLGQLGQASASVDKALELDFTNPVFSNTKANIAFSGSLFAAKKTRLTTAFAARGMLGWGVSVAQASLLLFHIYGSSTPIPRMRIRCGIPHRFGESFYATAWASRDHLELCLSQVPSCRSGSASRMCDDAKHPPNGVICTSHK